MCGGESSGCVVQGFALIRPLLKVQVRKQFQAEAFKDQTKHSEKVNLELQDNAFAFVFEADI